MINNFQLFLIVLLSLILAGVYLLAYIQMKSYFNSISNSQKQKDFEFSEASHKSVVNTLNFIQLSLFKMYHEMDILDYESISKKLHENLDMFAKNQDLTNQWGLKMKEYYDELNKPESPLDL